MAFYDNDTVATVDLLRILGTVVYPIPTFEVIKVRLKHVKIGVWDQTTVKHYDAFLNLNDAEEVGIKAPTTIRVVESCQIKVS